MGDDRNESYAVGKSVFAGPFVFGSRTPCSPGPSSLDQQLRSAMGRAAGLSQRAAERLSYLARPRNVLVETLVLASFPVFSRRERAALLVAWVVAGTAGHALKLYNPRLRPGKAKLSPEGDQSFPSTHTAHATALAFTLAEIARERGISGWSHPAAGAASAVVGLARVRAGAHWPTDALAGALLGVASSEAAVLIVRALAASCPFRKHA